MANIAKKNVKINVVENLKNFLNEVGIEFRKVIWPDKKFIFSATAIVLGIVIFSALYVIFVDWIISHFFGFLSKYLFNRSF